VTGRRFIVHGGVQGVGFRWFALRTAERLGLRGWVRNRPDGAVEAEAFGSPDALTQFGSALETGPASANVTHMEIIDISDEKDSLSGFEIKC
jgi:acylphosphatase